MFFKSFVVDHVVENAGNDPVPAECPGTSFSCWNGKNDIHVIEDIKKVYQIFESINF